MSEQALHTSFAAEIAEVQSTLLVATTDLTNPLGDLVRAHIKRSQPPICGAVVLAVSKSATTPEDGDLRRRRIVLAAALEMLHIALNVHRLLVNAAANEPRGGESSTDSSSDDGLDRAFIGSTILAGDYCFSRAAQLAAQTDSPRVVATFSLALQIVSEELLREQFDPENGAGSYDETRQLLQSGALAAAQLVGLSTEQEQAAVTLSQQLAAYWARRTHDTHGLGAQSDESYTQPFFSTATVLPPGWQALYHWLMQQRGNGATSAIPYPQLS